MAEGRSATRRVLELKERLGGAQEHDEVLAAAAAVAGVCARAARRLPRFLCVHSTRVAVLLADEASLVGPAEAAGPRRAQTPRPELRPAAAPLRH